MPTAKDILLHESTSGFMGGQTRWNENEPDVGKKSGNRGTEFCYF